jgi:hypothetical protein
MVGLPEVQTMATMDCPANYEHVDLNKIALYNASTLNLNGLPYDTGSFLTYGPPYVVRPAMMPSPITFSPSRCMYAYSHGSLTWEDVEVIGDAFRPMRV